MYVVRCGCVSGQGCGQVWMCVCGHTWWPYMSELGCVAMFAAKGHDRPCEIHFAE